MTINNIEGIKAGILSAVKRVKSEAALADLREAYKCALALEKHLTAKPVPMKKAQTNVKTVKAKPVRDLPAPMVAARAEAMNTGRCVKLGTA